MLFLSFNIIFAIYTDFANFIGFDKLYFFKFLLYFFILSLSNYALFINILEDPFSLNFFKIKSLKNIHY